MLQLPGLVLNGSVYVPPNVLDFQQHIHGKFEEYDK